MMSASKTQPKSTRTTDSAAAPDAAMSRSTLRLRLLRLLILLLIVAVGLFASRNWWGNAAVESQARRALAAHQPERALAWMDRGAQFTAPTGTVLLLRARAYRQMGQLGDVNSALEAAAKHGAPLKDIRLESDLALAQSGQLSAVHARLPQLLIDANDDTNEVCEAFVIGYLRNQRFNDALQLLAAWIADWPNDPRPLLLRSRVWMLETQSKLATTDLQRAHELAPRDTEITYELAAIHRHQNEWAAAAQLYESCLADPKWAPRAKLGLGLCQKALGDDHASGNYLEAAAREAPQNTEALREYGRHLVEHGRYPDAAEVLQRAVDLLPYDDELHYLLAQSLQSNGDRDAAAPHFAYVSEARTAFRELRLIQDQLRKEPKNIELLTRAGEILLRYSDPEEGVVRLMAVLDQQPTNQRARQLLVDHYSKRAETRPEFAALAEEHRRWLRPSTAAP